MSSLTLDQLTEIVRDVIGDSSLVLDAAGDASTVPGWDSLNHTLIMMEVNRRFGSSVDAMRASEAKDFADLISIVNASTR